MSQVERWILLAALLLLVGVASSKFAARFGVPVLVLFIGVGMLAGSDGLGGIAFDNHALANGVGTVALALILFDGGMRTSRESITAAWGPALMLSTVGVALTAILTGLAACVAVGLTIGEGMLLGAIVASTDAAAVFSVLRAHGLHLPERVGATLELESGSNDPMAIFLTVAALALLLDPDVALGSLVGLFVGQMGFGVLVGAAVGWLAVRSVNRADLSALGLYPALLAAFGLLAFGSAALLGGSGFLAVYVAGIVLGNASFVFRRGSFLFFDAAAWLAQIAMFVVLGLLSFPSRLIAVAPAALLVAAVLILVARPLAVAVALRAFGFGRSEVAFVAWGGLRGAVPILLATYPMVAGLERAEVLFDVVFFVVLVSALVQGSTLPWVARQLGLLEDRPSEPCATLEITSLRDVGADIVEYTIGARSALAGRTLAEAGLPGGVVVAMVGRAGQVFPPRGDTGFEVDDHVFVVLKDELREQVDAVFARAGDEAQGYSTSPIEVIDPASTSMV